MDLDEIQSVQSRERQTDSLQQLRDSFYEEAGEFVRSLRAERERAAEAAADPFDSPKVTRLSDDIDTAEQTLQAIYERRVGKVVKMASLAAADMPTEEDGLTTEERDLFEDLVDSIESNRQRVFDVLDGESMSVAGDSAHTPPDGDSPTEGVDNGPPDVTDEGSARADAPESTAADREAPGSPAEADGMDQATAEEIPAADLMGSDTSAEEASAGADATAAATPDDDAKARPAGSPDDGSERATRRDGGPPDPSTDPGDAESASVGESVERTTVRIKRDVGEILGVDDRTYDLVAEDVVTLPATNAEPLIERGVAETLQ